MSQAIGAMVQFLLAAPGWHADRNDSSGPHFANAAPTYNRDAPERNPALKARILTELERGKATSDEIAKRLHVPQQEVGAKLSRLYADGHIERALTATSPHTGRKVLLYWIRKE